MGKTIKIFTDGSSRGNPGPGGWGSVVVIDENKVVELGGGEKHTTNNRMELQAAIGALSYISNQKLNADSLLIYTDSSYVVNGITKWVSGWKTRGWKTLQKDDVLNRDLWEILSELAEALSPDWKIVPGHSAIVGNERCDVIATEFADGKKVYLYDGSYEGYSIKNILDISYNEADRKERSASRARSSAPAYSYVSMVGGKIETHKTWAECEKRVRGTSGARFKKSFSSENEAEIISEFKEKK